MTILGISIGTTRTGVCVLQDTTLLERRLHNYYASWSEKKLYKMLKQYRRYIQKFEVTAIIIKIPPLQKHNKEIRQIIDQIEILAHEYNCVFDLITKREMKHIIGSRTTAELIRYARSKYAELVAYFDREGKGYYDKLYEAILAAHILQHRLNMKALQDERMVL